jgi:hypothetical protein
MSAFDSVELAYQQGREAWEGLTPRDRLYVTFIVTVVLCVAAYFAHTSMTKARAKVKGQIAAVEFAQSRVDSLLLDYQAMVGDVEKLDARLEAGRTFAPLTWLESVGKEMDISGNLRSIQERGIDETDFYKAQKLDVVIEDVDLRQTVDFLYRLESAPQAIRVVECRIKTDRKDRTKLDLRMEVAVLKPLDA